MDRVVEIRRLTQEDDRSGFSCGEPAIDRFFHYYAGQNQFRLHLGVTYVAALGPRILGFATVTVASLERESVPDARLKKRLPSYPLPVLRLARLGVDARAQGQGVGRALLRHVLELAVEQREKLGCVGVVVDVKSSALTFYERLGFVLIEGVREGLLLTEPQPMFMAIETIARAMGC